jgi:hypothetical protein
MLTLYRRALHLRRTEFPPATPMTWLPAPAGVLAFTRGSLTCITNLSPAPPPPPPRGPPPPPAPGESERKRVRKQVRHSEKARG